MAFVTALGLFFLSPLPFLWLFNLPSAVSLSSACAQHRDNKGLIFSSALYAGRPLILRISSLLLDIFSMKPLYLFFFFCRVLLRLRGYPMQPHVLRVFILEKASSIQYSYRKCGTHARLFSRTHEHGNSKIEISKIKIKGKKARRKE